MIRILIGWAILTMAVMAASALLPGVRVKNWGTAFVAAAILGILNALLRPVLVFLTFPITIVTLGLFLFVINALLFQLASALVEGFEVKSFGWALLGSLVVSLVSIVANLLL